MKITNRGGTGHPHAAIQQTASPRKHSEQQRNHRPNEGAHPHAKRRRGERTCGADHRMEGRKQWKQQRTTRREARRAAAAGGATTASSEESAEEGPLLKERDEKKKHEQRDGKRRPGESSRSPPGAPSNRPTSNEPTTRTRSKPSDPSLADKTAQTHARKASER